MRCRSSRGEDAPMSQPPGPRRGRLLSGGVAPFGRLGRWLGFRWVFPIGTLAVPFHPLLARALLWLPAVLVAYTVALTVAGRDGGGAPLALRRAERRNAAVTPVVPGHRGLEVTGWQSQDTARWLVEHCDLPRVSADGRSRLRVDAATYARVGDVSTRISTGFMREDGDVLVVQDLQPTAVRVHAHRHRGWWRVLGGDQTTWEVTDGDLTQRLVSTKPSLVRGPPVFACFRFVAVFGGQSQWVIGFSRRTVPTPADGREGLAHAFPPLGNTVRTVVDSVEVLAPLEGALADAHRRYGALLDELAAAP